LYSFSGKLPYTLDGCEFIVQNEIIYTFYFWIISMKQLLFVSAIAAGTLCLQPVTEFFFPSIAHAVTKTQKKRATVVCRKKYGKAFARVTFNKRGTRYTCYYHKSGSSSGGKNRTREEVTEWCKKRYKGVGEGLHAIRKGGKWLCQYRH
jgi:hypothetical protein